MKNSKDSSLKLNKQKTDKIAGTETPRFPSIDIKANDPSPTITTPKRYPTKMELPE